MKDLKDKFKRAGGVQILRQYMQSHVLGYALIFFLMPFFLKMLLKRSGIGGPPGGRPPQGPPPRDN